MTRNLRGEYKAKVNYSRADFHEGVRFVGRRFVYASIGTGKENTKPSEVRWLFYGIVLMNGVVFRKPEIVKFLWVNLSKASVVETNFRRVQFIDVAWWQPVLQREGIYDEIALASKDKDALIDRGRQVESAYRNIRLSLEENKEYLATNDFYIGEMDSRLKRRKSWLARNFCIEKLYRVLSVYGTSPARAVFAFFSILSVHVFITVALTPEQSHPIWIKDMISDYLAHSIQVMTLQKPSGFLCLSDSQKIIDSWFRVIGPVQLAVIALALRNSIRRY